MNGIIRSTSGAAAAHRLRRFSHRLILPTHELLIARSQTRCYGEAVGPPSRAGSFEKRGLMSAISSSCVRRAAITAMLFAVLAMLSPVSAHAQGLGGAGTIQGVIKDATGGILPGVSVRITSPVSGFSRETVTDAKGAFAFQNLPPNHYHVAATLTGFATFDRDVDVRSAVPIDLPIAMAVAGTSATVKVVGHADLVERDSTAHTDVDQGLIDKLPTEASAGLNRIVTMASPGVVADSNSFFHPIGDHAQTQFSIDNQPVTDQQSRVYSNQISADAVQSMEIITGVAPAGALATRAVSSCTSSPSRAWTRGSRPETSRSDTDRSARRPWKRISGPGPARSAISRQSAGRVRIAILIRRSSRPFTTTARPSLFRPARSPRSIGRHTASHHSSGTLVVRRAEYPRCAR